MLVLGRCLAEAEAEVGWMGDDGEIGIMMGVGEAAWAGGRARTWLGAGRLGPTE